jgi:hypothetical protein
VERERSSSSPAGSCPAVRLCVHGMLGTVAVKPQAWHAVWRACTSHTVWPYAYDARREFKFGCNHLAVVGRALQAVRCVAAWDQLLVPLGMLGSLLWVYHMQLGLSRECGVALQCAWLRQCRLWHSFLSWQLVVAQLVAVVIVSCCSLTEPG